MRPIRKNLRFFFLPLAVVAALAGFSMFRAYSGELDPPGPPAPTMHTLEEIYTLLRGVAEQTRCRVPALELADGRGELYLTVGGLPGPDALPDGTPGAFRLLGASASKELAGPGALPVLSHQRLRKRVDGASPTIYVAASDARRFEGATIQWFRGGDRRELYYTQRFTGVRFTSAAPVVVRGTPGNIALEDVSFVFETVEWMAQRRDEPSVRAGWNVLANRKL